ncbi:hypothetical protein BX600DRAFT_468189 [Xylariales sp. PMI_506]|nr:hypothetical protein BX600DRAFT_468189 [Xylariales sp. PMI_506]
MQRTRSASLLISSCSSPIAQFHVERLPETRQALNAMGAIESQPDITAHGTGVHVNMSQQRQQHSTDINEVPPPYDTHPFAQATQGHLGIVQHDTSPPSSVSSADHPRAPLLDPLSSEPSQQYIAQSQSSARLYRRYDMAMTDSDDEEGEETWSLGSCLKFLCVHLPKATREVKKLQWDLAMVNQKFSVDVSSIQHPRNKADIKRYHREVAEAKARLDIELQNIIDRSSEAGAVADGSNCPVHSSRPAVLRGPRISHHHRCRSGGE